MKPRSRWKLYLSGLIATIGVLIVIGILSGIAFFYIEAREIDKMAANFRLQLDRAPNGFDFVELNSGFFFFKLNEPVSPYRECISVSPVFRKPGKFQISIGEEYELGSIDRALKMLKKIRREQNCTELTALYFKAPTPGFRRVSVRMTVDADGALTTKPEFKIYD
jgi:hypothetical protein